MSKQSKLPFAPIPGTSPIKPKKPAAAASSSSPAKGGGGGGGSSKRKSKGTDGSSLSSKRLKLSSVGADLNKDIIDILNEMGKNERSSGNGFKAVAYFTAIRSLKGLSHRIENGAAAMRLDGVGKKIAAKIDEILASGRLEALDKRMADPRQVAKNELTSVYGIGPKKALELMDTHSVMSIDDLRDNKHLLNAHQRLGLQFVDQFKLKIPRSEMRAMEAYIRYSADRINSLNPSATPLHLTFCGSYRRGAKECGDIDVLLTTKTWKEGQTRPSTMDKLVAAIKKDGFITHDLGFGPKKYSGICRIGTTHARAAAPQLRELIKRDEKLSSDETDAKAAGTRTPAAAAAPAGDDSDSDSETAAKIRALSGSDDDDDLNHTPSAAAAASTHAAVAVASPASSSPAPKPQPKPKPTARDRQRAKLAAEAAAASKSTASATAVSVSSSSSASSIAAGGGGGGGGLADAIVIDSDDDRITGSFEEVEDVAGKGVGADADRSTDDAELAAALRASIADMELPTPAPAATAARDRKPKPSTKSAVVSVAAAASSSSSSSAAVSGGGGGGSSVADGSAGAGGGDEFEVSDDSPHRRIDIRFIPYGSYYTAIQYFTGSGEFNRRLRLRANELGYTLNEYHLSVLATDKDEKSGAATAGGAGHTTGTGGAVAKSKMRQTDDLITITYRLNMVYVPPNERNL